MTRKTHSTIDNLPKPLQDTLLRMTVDNVYPADFPGEPTGSPTIDDMVEYCTLNGYAISRSAMGRWSKSKRTYERMRTAGLIARETMTGLDDENATQTQKAAAEMMTAILIEQISSEKELKPKDIAMMSGAIRDCTHVALNADKYIRTQIQAKTRAADKEITKTLKKKNIDPETLKMIREQIYGITS